MKVLLRAPLLTNSGYGVHSRQIFEWLYKKPQIELDVECLKWGNTPWNLDTTDTLTNEIMLRSKGLTPPYDLAIQVQLPDEWDQSLGKKNIGVSAFVETDRCSQKWVEACNQMDYVIVPSTFTKNVAKRSGSLKSKISVVPEWFNHDILEETNNLKNFNISTSNNFLMVAQLTDVSPELDRKNIASTISWFFECFKNDPDTGLIIKTNMGRGTSKDKIITSDYIKNVVAHFRNDNPFPKIHLVHGNMTSKEISSLFKLKSVKGFISTTRGEGYGLPLIDAAAAGIPVIVTNWSGHLEFLKEDMFLGVDYDMVQIPDQKIDERIFYKGFKWADPRKESFISCLQKLNSNYDEHKCVAKELSVLVRNQFNKEQVMQLYDKIFNEVVNT